MGYATRADLETRFGSGEIATLEDGSDVRIEAALTDASAEVDAYLEAGYALPLPEGRYPLLVSVACDLARLKLHDDAPAPVVLARAHSARKRLVELAGGAIALLAEGAGTVRRRTGGAKAAGGLAPVMTDANLAGL